MEYNSGSNRASDLKLRARLLPGLYDTKSNYQLIVTITKFEKNMTVVYTISQVDIFNF